MPASSLSDSQESRAVLDFFGRGASEGVEGRFSPRETMLESVSAEEFAELDMRREE